MSKRADRSRAAPVRFDPARDSYDSLSLLQPLKRKPDPKSPEKVAPHPLPNFDLIETAASEDDAASEGDFEAFEASQSDVEALNGAYDDMEDYDPGQEPVLAPEPEPCASTAVEGPLPGSATAVSVACT